MWTMKRMSTRKMISRVFHKTQNVSDRAPDGGHAVSIYRGPPKFLNFYLNIWPDAQHICVLGRIAGKTAQKRPKIVIFQNWPANRPKMEVHGPNVYSTVLGGVSQGFWNPFFE